MLFSRRMRDNGEEMSPKKNYPLFENKKSLKIKVEKPDEDDIVFVEEITQTPKNTSTKTPASNLIPKKEPEAAPERKSPVIHIVHAISAPKPSTNVPPLYTLMDFKQELTDDSDDNLLNQFFSQELDTKYDSGDELTVYHKSTIDDNDDENNNKNEKPDEEEIDEDIIIMKDNELFFQKIIDLTRDDEDTIGDDDKPDSDGFTRVKCSLAKVEPTSPIVLRQKKSEATHSSPLVLSRSNSKRSSESDSEATKKKSEIVKSQSSNTDSDSDLVLAELAAKYERESALAKSKQDHAENRVQMNIGERKDDEDVVKMVVEVSSVNIKAEKVESVVPSVSRTVLQPSPIRKLTDTSNIACEQNVKDTTSANSNDDFFK